MVFLLSLLLPLFLLISSPVQAASATFLSKPDQVLIGEEFTVNFSIDSLEASSSYKIKSRIGKDTSHLTKGQTKSNSGEWLSDSSGWDSDFPLLSTNETGSFDGQIVSRVSPTVGEPGDNLFSLRVLKSGDDSSNSFNIEGSFTFLVSAAPSSTPTPTSTLTPTKTPTPSKTTTPTKTPTPQTQAIVSTSTPSPIRPTITRIPTKKPTLKPTPTGKVLGATKEATPSGISKKDNPLPTAIDLRLKKSDSTRISQRDAPTGASQSDLPKILLVFGGLFLVGMGGSILWMKKIAPKL